MITVYKYLKVCYENDRAKLLNVVLENMSTVGLNYKEANFSGHWDKLIDNRICSVMNRPLVAGDIASMKYIVVLTN